MGEARFGEPWRTDRHTIRDRHGEVILSLPDTEAVARIADCVNPCAGLDCPADFIRDAVGFLRMMASDMPCNVESLARIILARNGLSQSE